MGYTPSDTLASKGVGEMIKRKQRVWSRPVFCSAFVLAFLAYLSPTANAAGRSIAAAVEQDNDTGQAKTDFHMQITSDTNMDCTVTSLRVDGGPPVQGNVTNNNTASVSIDWTVNIPNGSTVAAGCQCTQDERNDFTVEAHFTPRSSAEAPMLGWTVTTSGEVFLNNGNPVAVAFTDLRRDAPSALTMDDVFDALAGLPTGTPASVSSGVVPPGSPDDPGRSHVDSLTMNVGDFLLARMETSFYAGRPADADPTVVVLGHEHQAPVEPPVPTVSEWGLVVMTLAALTVGTIALGWRRRRMGAAG
jgi:hypothetical protein